MDAHERLDLTSCNAPPDLIKLLSFCEKRIRSKR